MRNEWFPQKKAEYMTESRFRELGLTRDDIGERDPSFGTVAATEPVDVPEPEAQAPTVLVTTVRVLRCPPHAPARLQNGRADAGNATTA